MERERQRGNRYGQREGGGKERGEMVRGEGEERDEKIEGTREETEERLCK